MPRTLPNRSRTEHAEAGREEILNLDNFRKAARCANCDHDSQRSHVGPPESSDAICRIYLDLHGETSLASADNPSEH